MLEFFNRGREERVRERSERTRELGELMGVALERVLDEAGYDWSMAGVDKRAVLVVDDGAELAAVARFEPSLVYVSRPTSKQERERYGNLVAKGVTEMTEWLEDGEIKDGVLGKMIGEQQYETELMRGFGQETLEELAGRGIKVGLVTAIDLPPMEVEGGNLRKLAEAAVNVLEKGGALVVGFDGPLSREEGVEELVENGIEGVWMSGIRDSFSIKTSVLGDCFVVMKKVSQQERD